MPHTSEFVGGIEAAESAQGVTKAGLEVDLHGSVGDDFLRKSVAVRRQNGVGTVALCAVPWVEE